MIRDALPMDDAERVAEIYNHYVAQDIATFEVDQIGGAIMANRIASVQDAGLPWIVATDALGVVGYAYASPFHDRAAYRHTVTVSVYLDRAERGHGLGRALYTELVQRVGQVNEGPHAPVHSLVALIALPNAASVALHEALGFKHAGTLAEAGLKFDSWINMGYWQKSLVAHAE